MPKPPSGFPRRYGLPLVLALLVPVALASALALGAPDRAPIVQGILAIVAITALCTRAVVLSLPRAAASSAPASGRRPRKRGWLFDRFSRPRRPSPSLRSVEQAGSVEWFVGTASNAAMILDAAGTIRLVGPAVTAVLGYRAEELLDVGIDDIVSPPDVPGILRMLSGTDLANTHAECRVRHRDGRWLTVDMVGTKLGGDTEIGRLLLVVHDVTKWKALEEQLTGQAFHDPLTGLANRALFADRLEHALGRRRYHAKGVAVLFLDLDDFKTVNDTLGHSEGDKLIRQVADRLTETVRPGDTAARLGGDEFALLLDDVDEDEAIGVASRAIAALTRPFDLTDRTVRIGVTIGIALSSSALPSATDMLRAADIAMYSAKASGKGRYRIFEQSMYHEAAERLRLGVDIRGAVERGEFVVHYQPIVQLPAGTLIGMEALVRWAHPELGIIPPADFVPLAESTGLIVQLGELVLREACRQARAWQRATPGKPALTMAVNLSGVQLMDSGLVAAVSMALEDSELDPELLILEITESVLANETEQTVRRVRQLRGLGIRIAIDDFGTGYSSLSYLRRFPVDTVKIDKSFVEGVAGGPDGLALVRAIVRMAHSLNLKTVAEGVEHEAQVKRLTRAGCDLAQGYYFARPMDAKEATAYVVGHTTINLWVGHTGHELDVIKEVVADFEALNPGLRVDVVGGASDGRIMTALSGSDGPDVVCSIESDTFATYSTAGGFHDLRPFMERDGIDVGLLTEATQAYTRNGDRQWALPMLADAYGLYLNRKLLAEAGLTRPPRTIDELTDYAKKLTKRNPDGSLRVVGFHPLVGFYENVMAIFCHMFGAGWTPAPGGSGLAKDPAWIRMLQWQKELIDWYGYEDLVRFAEQVGEEFTPANAFQMGKLAMSLDGEWRVAFIASEAPHVDYQTAPLPVDDARPELYGSGYINGSVIGIPSSAGYLEESWRLVRYLALDDRALAKLSNGLRNVPSTKAALKSPDLIPDERFAIFLDIFGHPRSQSTPIAPESSAFGRRVSTFASEWQAGQVPDLRAGLRGLDREVDVQLRLAGNRAASREAA